jgi:predicted phage-related endonuclease
MQITRETIAHATEADWLAARKLDLTSTECAGLFNAGVYENARTIYELHQVKAGLLAPAPFEASDRTVWGNRLEAAIAAGVAEDCGLLAAPFKCYMRIPELRMGSSFDFKIVGLAEHYEGDETARDLFRKHGEGILEIKNVDGLQFRRAWLDDGEVIEAPPHIEFQVSHQLEVAGLEWSIIAPLVGGNTPKIVFRERDAAVGEAIRLKCAEFWLGVDMGDVPPPDFTKDGATIARVYRDNDGSSIDLTDNAHLAALCMAYKAAGADEKAAAERKSAAKAEILTIVQAAKSIAADGFKISAGTNKESYRCYTRQASQRISISVSQIKECEIEATVAPFRNVRISEAA